ncbi:MAG TPA: TetR/AcrR family transcriptional regulator [Acidimicrobiales bacterium]|nr:TetR/AcrR family transcriptional regulator [Acidimicrobiales bacterium]
MADNSSNSTKVRPGGRTARTREAVYAATLAELVARGYAQTSVEAIAQRAGVHKTTVYRRWCTKDQLVAEALAHAATERTEVADTGDIDDDMRTLARAVVATLTSRDGLAIVRALVAEAPNSPELGEVLRSFWTSRWAHVGPIITAAIERGQLPPATSPSELMKFIAAPLYYQLLMTDEPLSDQSADRAAAAALAAARAGVLGAQFMGP